MRPTFIFDGNMANGVIDSQKEWKRIVGEYRAIVNDAGIPLTARRGDDLDGIPAFGFGADHAGETLKDWATRQSLTLPV